MNWNLKQDDLQKIIEDFLDEKVGSEHFHVGYETLNGTTLLRAYWQDFADNTHFGILHLMNIEIRYVENIIFSISVNGERGMKPSKRDRDFLLNVYLKSLLDKLKPYIGKPQSQLSSWYPLRDLQITYLEIEWKNDYVLKVLDALQLVSSFRTVISSEDFIS